MSVIIKRLRVKHFLMSLALITTVTLAVTTTVSASAVFNQRYTYSATGLRNLPTIGSTQAQARDTLRLRHTQNNWTHGNGLHVLSISIERQNANGTWQPNTFSTTRSGNQTNTIWDRGITTGGRFRYRFNTNTVATVNISGQVLVSVCPPSQC